MGPRSHEERPQPVRSVHRRGKHEDATPPSPPTFLPAFACQLGDHHQRRRRPQPGGRNKKPFCQPRRQTRSLVARRQCQQPGPHEAQRGKFGGISSQGGGDGDDDRAGWRCSVGAARVPAVGAGGAVGEGRGGRATAAVSIPVPPLVSLPIRSETWKPSPPRRRLSQHHQQPPLEGGRGGRCPSCLGRAARLKSTAVAAAPLSEELGGGGERKGVRGKGKGDGPGERARDDDGDDDDDGRPLALSASSRTRNDNSPREKPGQSRASATSLPGVATRMSTLDLGPDAATADAAESNPASDSNPTPDAPTQAAASASGPRSPHARATRRPAARARGRTTPATCGARGGGVGGVGAVRPVGAGAAVSLTAAWGGSLPPPATPGALSPDAQGRASGRRQDP